MKKQNRGNSGNKNWGLRFMILAVFGLFVGIVPFSAQAGIWYINSSLAPTTADWNVNSTGYSGTGALRTGYNGATCGTYLTTYATPLGAGNFIRCAGGVPAGDTMSGDGNHLSLVATGYVGAGHYSAGARFMFNDGNGDGVPDSNNRPGAMGTADVKLIFLSLEQHIKSNTGGSGGVRSHMHTRGGLADMANANNCPSSISVSGQPVRTVTCQTNAATALANAAQGTWDNATNRIVWTTQLMNVHEFGYVDCQLGFTCGMGGMSSGLNWREGNKNWDVARVQGSANEGAGPMLPWQFTTAVDFGNGGNGTYMSGYSFTGSGLVFNSQRVDVDNTSNNVTELWFRGHDLRAGYDPVPEPGTALLVLGGLVGLAVSRRKN